jgi:hypothetical protein
MNFTRKLKIKGRTYLVEVESYWKDGRPKQRFVRYLGRLEGGKLIPPKSEIIKNFYSYSNTLKICSKKKLSRK